MARLEDQLRFSPEWQRRYRENGHALGYLTTTEALQREVVLRLWPRAEREGWYTSVEKGEQMIRRLPHLLGPKLGAQVSRYIAGSFASFPLRPLQVGEKSPAQVRLWRDDFHSFHEILASSSRTVILYGSSS